MIRLEDLHPNMSLRGICPDVVTIIQIKWIGSNALELTYKDARGEPGVEILYRDSEQRLEAVKEDKLWSFDGDGRLFRLVSEAHRIRLAYLFDPLLAVHTSNIEPLPHQITAVYEEMLPRQPLRFLLADDPGAGKTIMAGLLIKELMAREDVHRCLVVCPGNLDEQWQDELYNRFQLRFEIMTKEKLATARTGNWFAENNLVIARLDMLSRNSDIQDMLDSPDAEWDFVVCDEAHKMSASFFNGEIKSTKRYRLGRKLSSLTRHFLLMTATPHNGKEEDFQLFMALIDEDRFEGRFRSGAHTSDISDLMRRMVKEKLLKFDATPLFPQRIARTVPYHLSDKEYELYGAVTQYVREEFNRAEALLNDRRARNIGFALTMLQRRLASSPEAIYCSLTSRHKRLKDRREQIRREAASWVQLDDDQLYDEEELENLEDAPDQERENAENRVLDLATAASTIDELNAEISTLERLEELALAVRESGEDKKWSELAKLLPEILAPDTVADREAEDPDPGNREVSVNAVPSGQKIVIFTEHLATHSYLTNRVRSMLGQEAVATIRGSMKPGERRRAQEDFKHNPEVKVLVATDAASEGINLQSAHLMLNYDLPWNPNRLEQRFGRIHRIGQTETCFLWNLVAAETREGDVYRTLLEKLEQARRDLGGQVFDVLGRVKFGDQSLRDLLVEAIRFGESPEAKARQTKSVEDALDYENLVSLLDTALAPETMDINRVNLIRNYMERVEARRLQPHYIQSFFLEAFKEFGGGIRRREHRQYEVSLVPRQIRSQSRQIPGAQVQPQYERIVFEKESNPPQGQLPAEFICPGHPLLDATLDLALERYRDLMRRGAVLVDERDSGTVPRMVLYIEHTIQDGRQTKSGKRRVASRRMSYVEMDVDGTARLLHYAPYLDYRPLQDGEPTYSEILRRPECSRFSDRIHEKAEEYAVEHIIPEHLGEVAGRRQELIAKTRIAVEDRLTKEIKHLRHRADELSLQEQAGRTNSRQSSNAVRRRAEELQARLGARMAELESEEKLAPLPPVIAGGMLVVPIGMLHAAAPDRVKRPESHGDTQLMAARARRIVMDEERKLGFEPVDREHEKIGYDIESRDPRTGRLRFIEVKGRSQNAAAVTVTRNEILYSLNKPDDFILAIVEFKNDDHQVHYIRRPFQRDPDFGVTSVNYSFAKLLKRAEPPG